MSGVDAVDYRNGQKNNWRRSAWNVIASVTPDKRNALVLYLPGSVDLDRGVAVQKGFHHANMIAVERDPRIADSLRGAGVTVIQNDLLSVVRGWPDQHHIGVVAADLQCGFSSYVAELLDAYATVPAADGAVLLLNLQRGRDVPVALESDRLVPPSEFERTFYDLRDGPHLAEKSRVHDAVSWLDCAMADDLDAISGYAECVLDSSLDVGLNERERLWEFRRLLHFKMCNRAVVALRPYRSTPTSPYFDSFVTRYRSFLKRHPVEGDPTVRRQIAAALAIRTRRLRGELLGRVSA